MVAQTKFSKLKDIPQSRRRRLFGLNNSILSNATAYLNPYEESNSLLTTEKAAMYAAVTKFFNESD